ncbi:MAG: hypothetical protein AAB214_07145 [Fibrobacterota bacterium]
MPRYLQSSLFPGNATSWIEALRAQSRLVSLSSAHPSLLVVLESSDDGLFVRHELVFGLFRTVWTLPATLDLEARRLTCKGSGRFFQSIEQTLCWEETDHGISVQSELSWTGGQAALEDLLLRSILRFANTDPAVAASERPTQRIAMDNQAAA